MHNEHAEKTLAAHSPRTREIIERARVTCAENDRRHRSETIRIAIVLALGFGLLATLLWCALTSLHAANVGPRAYLALAVIVLFVLRPRTFLERVYGSSCVPLVVAIILLLLIRFV